MLVVPSGITPRVAAPHRTVLPPAREGRARPPIAFEINAGQTDARVSFLARGRDFTLFLTSNTATLRLRAPRSAGSPADTGATNKLAAGNVRRSDAVLSLRLAGANPAPQVEGLGLLPGRSHYFLGRDPQRWRTNIPHYGRVRYHDVYPSVDLAFHGDHGSLEYDFLVAPGGDRRRIQLELDGADALRIDDSGELIARVGGGEVRQARPIVYQEWADGRHFLTGRYVMRGARRVGFEVDGSRADLTLVIDPVLDSSSFLGGSSADVGHAVAIDANDNVYLTGETISTDFPTVIPEQPFNAGGADAFVTKLDSSGTVELFSSYLGGSGQENDFHAGVESSGVAVDAVGNVYLAGRTNSVDFPVARALFNSYRGGDEDGFVAKLSNDGSTLLYSTYLGGANNDSANGIAVDSAGNMYVTGGTKSDQDFPITPGVFQSASGGGTDAFIVKIDPTQTGAASLVYSSFLGGSGTDRGTAVAVDSSGNAYVTGRTDTPDSTFPIVNPFQGTNGGGVDAFVSVVNSNATQLVYSTFLGGSGLDVGNGIAIDNAGNMYVAGETASPNFPTTANGFQQMNAGSSDAFVAQLDPTGSVLLYATYLGGGSLDRATGVAVIAPPARDAGKLWVTGETSSANFPVLNAFQGNLGGGKDAFVAQLDPGQQGAASLLHSSFLGGTADDFALGIAVNSSGNAWVIGPTSSATTFPIVGAVQAVFGGGGSDAFVALVSSGSGAPDYSVSATPSSAVVMGGDTASYTITVTPTGGFTGTIDLSATGLPANSMASFAPAYVVITDATPQRSAMSVHTSASTPLGGFQLTVNGTNGASQHATQVMLTVTGGMDTADLSVTIETWPSPVAVQTPLTYRVRVSNLGPAMATGVQLTDALPAATFVSATSTQGTCGGSVTVTCSIGALDVGSLVTVTIVVLPQAGGSIDNTATVTGNQPDPTPDDNTATVETSVVQTGGVPIDVLQHHLHATRDALYVDPLFTQSAASTIHRDLNFSVTVPGPVYAQPLYVTKGPGSAPAYIVATEQNAVVAIDASDGSQLWRSDLGTPVPRSALNCGDVDPVGIVGTPVIDSAARMIFLDAMTTPDAGVTKQHFIYALSLDDGSVIPGWPVDVNTLSYNGLSFDSGVQGQRGALLLNGGMVYVPYGGNFGDCTDFDGTPYHGWVVAVAENDPTSAVAWATDGNQAGIWAVGGLSTDGNSVFAATGNTSMGTPSWRGGEAIIRLGLDDTFSCNPICNPANFFAPSNWALLDQFDLDLGDEAPLIVDVPGATPSQLIVALGKSGVAHLLDRNNFGGFGTGDGENGEGVYSVRVAIDNPPGNPLRGRIRTAAATYTAASGTYVVFSVGTPGSLGVGCPGDPGDLVALLISASSPPTVSVAWCANDNGPGAPFVGRGAPIVTTTDGSSQPIVWTIGAEGTNRLFAYDGETGAPLFSGGGPNELMTQVRRFMTPIAVNGRIIVVSDDTLYVFTTQ
jgi:uncharacterized repeat protein (TIGR01451 family)